MSTMTRTGWQKLRDKHKVPKGLVKGVNIGGRLDDVAKAGNDIKKRVKALEAAAKDFEKYHGALTMNQQHKAFAPIFKKELLDPATQDLKDAKSMEDPAANLKKNINDTIQAAKSLPAEPDELSYRQFYLSAPIRLILMNCTLVVKQTPALKPAFQKWQQVYAAVNDAKLQDATGRAQAVKVVITAAQVLYSEAIKLKIF